MAFAEGIDYLHLFHKTKTRIMKTIIFYSLLILTITTAVAQGEIEIQTKSIKIENFISYVANQEKAPTEKRIFLALEIGPNGLQAEERFYIEQGIALLSKRVTENGLLAIGTYGSNSDVILQYTAISALKDISTLITNTHKKTKSSQDDGIDLAYKNAEIHAKEGIENSVWILRNDNVTAASYALTPGESQTDEEKPKEPAKASNHTKIGGAIALTALTILPDLSLIHI